MRTFRMPATFAFNPNQPRDDHGRWTSAGAGVASTEDVARHAGVWGTGDIDSVFRQLPLTAVPFPSARRLKNEPKFSRDKVMAALAEPVQLTDVDPRSLRAIQPNVTREGVNYYLGDDYDVTGLTYADRGDRGNQWPIVERRERTGELIIVSGHHRATAALIAGRPLRAIVV